MPWAKALGARVPSGAFWLTDRAIDAAGTPLPSLMGPGSHGSTYGGNPLVAAAALAVLREIREKELAAHALLMEVRIRETIRSWNLAAIKEVRGSGLLLGVGLDPALIPVPEGKTPALVVVTKLMERGLLVPPAGPDTFRLLPPLNVTGEEIDEALAIENASPYGNAAAVYTRSGPLARLIARRASAGMVGVNVGVPVPLEPFGFGGWNDSRFGVGDIGVGYLPVDQAQELLARLGERDQLSPVGSRRTKRPRASTPRRKVSTST